MGNLEKIEKLTNSLSKVEENLNSEKNVLEFLIEHNTDGYWDWDIKNDYEYLSPKFKSQLGYKDSEMENKPESWQKLCNVEDLESAGKKIEECLGGKSDYFDHVLRFTHKKGNEVKIICRGQVIEKDADGSVIRMVGTHQIIK